MFHCLPIVADVLQNKPRGSSTVVVRSLMEDQVTHLRTLGVRTIAIKDDEDPVLVQQVTDGVYPVVLGSPEC